MTPHGVNKVTGGQRSQLKSFGKALWSMLALLPLNRLEIFGHIFQPYVS